MERFGPLRLSQASLITSGIGMALVASAQLGLVILGALVIGAGYGPLTVASSTILVKRTPERLREVVDSIDGPVILAFEFKEELRRLRATFGRSHRYSIDGFIGASPELLVERAGESGRLGQHLVIRGNHGVRSRGLFQHLDESGAQDIGAMLAVDDRTDRGRCTLGRADGLVHGDGGQRDCRQRERDEGEQQASGTTRVAETVSRVPSLGKVAR